jgi:hypothetical protein
MENRNPNAQDNHDDTKRHARLLSENHRRVLSTTLMRIELAVWRLEERITRENPPALTLTRFTDTLDARQRAELLRLIAQVRQHITQLTQEYGLEAREDDLTRTIMAEFSLLWSDLEDTRPKKLRNYGELHPHAIEQLGPQIQQLISLVLAIDQVVH